MPRSARGRRRSGPGRRPRAARPAPSAKEASRRPTRAPSGSCARAAGSGPGGGGGVPGGAIRPRGGGGGGGGGGAVGGGVVPCGGGGGGRAPPPPPLHEPSRATSRLAPSPDAI